MPFASIKKHHLLLVALIGISSISLFDYIAANITTFALGIISLVATSIRNPALKNNRYAIAAVIVWIFTLLVPVKTLLFFVSVFIFIYWLETFYASVSFLGVAALIICSPIFQYILNAFSFPIRLQLTSWVSGVFNFLQSDITAKGNVIFHKGYEFAIDPACMGLHMLSISVLSGVLLAGLLQKKYGKYLSWKTALLFLAGLFLLNLIANLIRIILLVQFTIMPDTIMHEVTGLVCLVLYVCIPAAWLARKLVVKCGSTPDYNHIKIKRSGILFLIILLCALLFTSILVKYKDTYAQFSKVNTQNIAGYNSSVFMPGILKLENQNALVYIKFIRGFYDTEHNPSICWKGSGYEFRNIKKQKIGNTEVFTALLMKDKDVLHTAWWFSNGNNNSIDQWEWRWDMLKGGNNYAVINLTSLNEQSLEKEVVRLLDENTLSPLFRNNGQSNQTIKK